MPKTIATLTLLGKDKTGAIAQVTQALFRLGANIEALEEQVTRGQFRMTLQASWSQARLDRDFVRTALLRVAQALEMEAKLHFRTAGRQRLALLVTREPHVLEGILRATRQPGSRAEPVLVLGSRPDLAPVAARFKIPFQAVSFQERAGAEAEVLRRLEEYEVDFMILARFMKILSPNFVWRWKNKIINIHPSLLPAFPGANAYRQAFERGVRVVGVTAHFVTPNLDEGPIIWQEALRVKAGESLASLVKRGQVLETRCVLRAMRAFLARRLDIHWGRVF